jgi:hypothetical protein
LSLLATPALILLLALPALIWFASANRSPKRREVGTHFIWAKLLETHDVASQKQRRLDLLLWLLLFAVIAGATSAARPATLLAEEEKKLAVYVDRVFFTGPEPQLEAIVQQSESLADGANITYFIRGDLPDGPLHTSGEVRLIDVGSNVAARSAFRTLAAEFNGKILFVLARDESANRVYPRLDRPLGNVIINVYFNDDAIHVSFRGNQPAVTGATIKTANEREVVLSATGAEVTLSSDDQTLVLSKPQFGVGIGAGWSTRRHFALLKALRPDDVAPDVWLGSEDRIPAICVALGEPKDLKSAEVHFDPAHGLFQELPLQRLDWLSEGRLLPAEDGVIPLVRVTQDGEVIGDLIRRKSERIEFAGDPFSNWPIEIAVILLDNAIAALTGQHPGTRQGWELTKPANLPALNSLRPSDVVASSDPVFRTSKAEQTERGHWLAILAGLSCLLSAALSGVRIK